MLGNTFIFILIFYIGMGAGMWMGLTLLGLLGGLFFLFLYKKDILNVPNPKIAGFAGYLTFQFVFFLIFFFSVFSSGYGSTPKMMIYVLSALFIIHPAIITGLFSTFSRKKSIQSNYCNLTLSYFLASLILGLGFLLLTYFMGSSGIESAGMMSSVI